jgi:hypothetical protein
VTVTRCCPACGYTQTYPSNAIADARHRTHSCPRHRRRADAAARRADRDAHALRRPCRHPGSPHSHGTRAAYVKDHCRCTDCTTANAAAWRTAARQQAYGRWQPFTDAAAVRDHIHTLRSAGIGVEQIAALADTSPRHIRDLARPETTTRPAVLRVRSHTAARILAITPNDANRAPGSRIDATGTRRRLQALVAVGWSTALLATALGRTTSNLIRTMTSRKVTAETAQVVAALYDQLWNIAPPQDTTAQRRAADNARAHASEASWLPPLAWDDIDIDNDPEPPTPETSTPNPGDLDEIAIERAINGDGIHLQHLTQTEQIEVIRRLTHRGKSIHDIADQLATTQRTVSRRRRATNAA